VQKVLVSIEGTTTRTRPQDARLARKRRQLRPSHRNEQHSQSEGINDIRASSSSLLTVDERGRETCGTAQRLEKASSQTPPTPIIKHSPSRPCGTADIQTLCPIRFHSPSGHSIYNGVIIIMFYDKIKIASKPTSPPIHHVGIKKSLTWLCHQKKKHRSLVQVPFHSRVHT
jgi:hypothetical protein